MLYLWFNTIHVKYSCVYFVISESPRVRSDGRKITLSHALTQNKLKDAERLIRAKVDVNKMIRYKGGYEEPPIIVAIRKRQFSLVPLLVQHHADVNATGSDGEPALIKEVKRKDCDAGVLRTLLAWSADPDVRCSSKRCALEYTVSHQNFTAARDLVKFGADVNAPCREGLKLLHLAASLPNVDMVKLLISNGAVVDVEQKGVGDTPLFKAIEYVNIAVAEELLKSGARADRENLSQDTPLHVAASKFNVELSRLLLEYGARHNALDQRGNTPLVRCLITYFQPCTSNAKFLIRHGSRLNDAKTRAGFNWTIQRSGDLSLIKLAVDAGFQLSDSPWALSMSNGINLSNLTGSGDISAVRNYVKDQLHGTRSLFDICRVSIREHMINISQGSSICERIQGLPLPRLVIKELLLEDN